MRLKVVSPLVLPKASLDRPGCFLHSSHSSMVGISKRGATVCARSRFGRMFASLCGACWTRPWRNVGAPVASQETCKITGKTCRNRLDVPRNAWLMCVIATQKTRRKTHLEATRNRTMNANEIAFGIEFETTLPSTDNTPIGPYHSGYQVPWLPTGWKAERDGVSDPRTPLAKDASL